MKNGGLKIRAIQQAVAEKYAITLEELINGKQRPPYPRYMAMLLAKAITERSLAEIGRMFERDHTVVYYGCKKAQEWLVNDVQFSKLYSEIKSQLEGSNG